MEIAPHSRWKTNVPVAPMSTNQIRGIANLWKASFRKLLKDNSPKLDVIALLDVLSISDVVDYRVEANEYHTSQEGCAYSLKEQRKKISIRKCSKRCIATKAFLPR